MDTGSIELTIISKYQEARSDWRERQRELSQADNTAIERLIAGLKPPYDYLSVAEATIAIEDILGQVTKPDSKGCGGSTQETPRKTHRVDPHGDRILEMRRREIKINGYMQCPGGCDTAVGGCIVHSDPC